MTYNNNWAALQNELADIPGQEGIERRYHAYKSFFLRLGRNVRIEEGCRFYHPDRISLLDDTRINIGTLIYGSGGVRIGRHVRIGPRCFIHSANHDVRLDEKAFFEKEYIYHSVYIGDNCLISANVSIMPGTCLGAGCFAACGALIPKGDYPDNSRLFGLPAKAMASVNDTAHLHNNPEPVSPSIALMVPGKGRYEQAANLLATVMGLPQLGIFTQGDFLPESVHTIISFGPPDRQPTGYDIPVWHFSSPGQILDGPVSLILPDTIEDEKQLNRVPPHKYYTVHGPDETKSRFLNAALLTVYYCLKRTKKENSAPNLKTQIERLLLALITAQLFPGKKENSELKKLLTSLSETGIDPQNIEKQLSAKIVGYIKDKEDCPVSVNGLEQKTFIKNPLIQFSFVFINMASLPRKPLIQTLKSFISSLAKAEQLAYLGLIGYIIDDQFVFDQACQKIFDNLYDETSQCIRSAPTASSYSYSPVLAALLLICAKKYHPDFDLSLEHEFNDDLNWKVFNGKGKWQITNDTEHGALIREDERIISESMLENLLKLMEVPKLEPGWQLEISRNNYQMQLYALESCWMSFLKYLQHLASEPLIQIKPWPYGYRGAMSLRYDVDRNVNKDQLLEAISIQKSEINADCASWYLIPGKEYNDRVQNLLNMYVQETGIHATDYSDLQAGQGVTFHSGPGAIYWRGFETVAAIEKAQAAYGEMFASQLMHPRPAWMEDGSEGRQTSVWLLPIHFPLEGTTRDVSLDYFDLLVEEFREMLHIGGHVIIGSHPDLNQNLLRELIQREQLENIWFAPVKDVVERCHNLLEYGSVSVVRRAQGELCLLSKNTLADVHVRIFEPGSTQPTDHCLQLNAGIPRKIY